MNRKTKGMYKNLTSYGDSGFSIFLRKAFIKGMGYSEEMLSKPIIGITNTYSDYNPCHGNVPDLIKSVKSSILASGAIPLEFPTITIHESFAYPTSMYLRNLMSIDTEGMDYEVLEGLDSKYKIHIIITEDYSKTKDIKYKLLESKGYKHINQEGINSVWILN